MVRRTTGRAGYLAHDVIHNIVEVDEGHKKNLGHRHCRVDGDHDYSERERG